MIVTADGSYLLGGYSNSDVGSEANRGELDYWVIRIDAQGNKLWDKTFGGSANDELQALVATPDGGYLLGGTSASSISGDKSKNNKGVLNEYGNWTSDYWIVKIDSLGNKLWDKTFGGNNDDNLTTLLPTTDGNYLLGGTSSSGISGDKSQPSQGEDYWVVKIDANGKKIWNKTLGEQIAIFWILLFLRLIMATY